jgi:hypothetical protein
MVPYNPSDWYWAVGDDKSSVFSSARNMFISIEDKIYTQWLNNGGIPTKILTKAELGEVLAPYSLRPNDNEVLDGYKEIQSRKLTLELVAKVLLWLINEVRTLKGQNTVGASQFRNFVKELM